VVEEGALVVVLLVHVGERHEVEIVVDHVGERADEVVEARVVVDDFEKLCAREQAVLLSAVARPDRLALLDRLYSRTENISFIVRKNKKYTE
jgi:hypothetical protein